MKNPFAFLGAYTSSTIGGISVLSGAFTGYILQVFDWRHAVAAAVGGLTAIAIKQFTGTTMVTGDRPTVNADTANIVTKGPSQ